MCIWKKMQWLYTNSVTYRGMPFFLTLSHLYQKLLLTKWVVSRLNLISAVTMSFLVWFNWYDDSVSMNCGPFSIGGLHFFWLKDPIMTTDEVVTLDYKQYITQSWAVKTWAVKNLQKINMTKTDCISSLISFEGSIYVYVCVFMCISYISYSYDN